jgi:predicted enzyme related to lactoylglutathione lyase
MAVERMDNVGIVVEDLDAAIARLRAHGADLVGEVAQYREAYRLCYVRGPEGVLIGLAQELRRSSAEEAHG